MATFILANTNSPNPAKAVIPLTRLPRGTKHPTLGRLSHKIKVCPGTLPQGDPRLAWYEEWTLEEATAAFREIVAKKPTLGHWATVAQRYFSSPASVTGLFIHFRILNHPLATGPVKVFRKTGNPNLWLRRKKPAPGPGHR